MTAPASTTEAGGGTTPPRPPSTPPALSPVELARWGWRQLTSMRTALVLLFLLALGAVPGSVVPQQNIDATKVSDWQQAHPTLAPIYEKLGLFSVYSSVWFSAIYILLMVSLIGCIVPRLRVYWRGFRAQPPRAPRNLTRLPQSRTFELDDDADAVLERARAVLRRRRFRVVVSRRSQARSSTTGTAVEARSSTTGTAVEARSSTTRTAVEARSSTDGTAVEARSSTDGDDLVGEVAAERGYLREAGNLLFHLSVLVALVGFAYGQLYGYKGAVSTVVGQGFSNTLSQYDDFAPGSLFDPDNLSPLSFKVDDFHVKYLTSGAQMGQPESFSADLTYRATPDAPKRPFKLSVNHPLQVNGASVFLVGNGYAPVVTVRDGQGHVAYKGPVIFLPQDSSYASFGVIKVPDAVPQQLGFEGLFLPTYGFTMARGPFSQFPDALDPVLSLVPYHGDLGMDDGKAQSVYELDKSGLKTFESKDPKRLGPVMRIKLKPGQTVQLPDGAGSIRFDGVQRWVRMQVSNNPGKGIALVGVLLGILGLMGSLFIRPRRAWARVRRRDGRTVVELAGLDRSSGGSLTDELDELEGLVRGHEGKP